MEKTYPYIEYKRESYTEAEMLKRSKEFHDWLDKRRTVRDFSTKSIPKEVIENILLAASTAPSSSHDCHGRCAAAGVRQSIHAHWHRTSSAHLFLERHVCHYF